MYQDPHGTPVYENTHPLHSLSSSLSHTHSYNLTINPHKLQTICVQKSSGPDSKHNRLPQVFARGPKRQAVALSRLTKQKE